MYIDYSLIKNYNYPYFISLLFTNKVHYTQIAQFCYFISELEAIRVKTSETTLAFIRLTWWREAIKAIYQNNLDALKSPSTESLKEIITTNKLEEKDLINIIELYSTIFDPENKDNKEKIDNGFTSILNIISQIYKYKLHTTIPQSLAFAWLHGINPSNLYSKDEMKFHIKNLRTNNSILKKLPYKIDFLSNLIVCSIHLLKNHNFKNHKLLLLFKLALNKLL
ncbi:MAG: hypothetical protein J0H68_00905 [Sphingobacteriia bacterium]|nr:hypothetical protein [Sphingobacteriia bacterium]